MIALAATLALATPWDDDPTATRMNQDQQSTPGLTAPWGYRIRPMGTGGLVSTGLAAVIGSTGGTTAAHVEARYGSGRFAGGVRLPFASFRTQDGRGTGLGNLHVDGQALIDVSGATHAVGVEAHVNLGGRAWTWVNQAEELWPGGGVDAVWQVRTEGDLAWLGRASAGVHGTQGFYPFPKVWGRIAAAGGVDWSATPALGFTGEAHVAYWEVSPIELTGLVRLEPTEGLRLRTGVLMPIASWAGLTPTAAPSGIREVTVVADLSMSL
jgi:hypothetical protein